MDFVSIESEEDFAREVVGHKGCQLGIFTADWCPHCKSKAPIVMEILGAMDNVRICRIDIDKAEKSTEELQILTIPTMAVFKDGKLTAQLMFAHSTKEEIQKFLDENYK